jgi:hypothetical protein
MFKLSLLFERQNGLPRMHGISGSFVAFLLAIVTTAGLVTGWIMCRILGARLLFGLPLAVIGAIAGVFLLDRVLAVSELFGPIHLDYKLIIDLVSNATIAASITVLPLWLFVRRAKGD